MDPILSKLAISIASKLAPKLIESSGRILKKKLLGTEKEQAVKRCLESALRGMLTSITWKENSQRDLVHNIFNDFFKDKDVTPALAELIKGNSLNREELREIFEDVGYDPQSLKKLPGFDFDLAISAFEKGFIDTAIEEKELQGIIQTEQLLQVRRLAEKQLKQQQDIKESVKSIEENVSGKASQDVARRRYLRHLRNYCQMLPLVALGEEGGTEQDLTLDDVYIELDTTTKVRPEEKVEKKSRKKNQGSELPETKDSVPLSTLKAASEVKRMVLLGDPGAGKSTFVKKLCGWLAAVHLGEAKPPAGFDDKLIPILIVLRELTPELIPEELQKLSGERHRESLVQSISNCILENLRLWKATAFADRLWEILNSGQCLLVFDGLDEVPTDKREIAVQAVHAMITKFRNINRVIVTCRIRSYAGKATLPNFNQFTLAKLEKDQIKGFIHAWYNGLVRLNKLEHKIANKEREDLIEATLSDKLLPMARNPMMLTSMAIIRRKRRLPEEKTQLFKLLVEVLLRRWQEEKFGEEELELPEELQEILNDDVKLRELVERLAFETHQSGKDKEEADLERSRAIDILSEPKYLNDLNLAKIFLDYLDQRAGLLSGRGGELDRPVSYSFAHRQLQEYLAGSYIMGLRYPLRECLKLAGEGDYWGEAVQLGFEELRYNRRDKNTLLDLAYRLCPSTDLNTEKDERAALWSAYIAVMLGREEIAQDTECKDGGVEYLECIFSKLVGLLGGRLPPIERATAGRNLAQLGDPREEVLKVDHMQFCYIPGGDFYMGEGEKEKLNKTLTGGFWLALFPVTNAQFKEFVDDGGYSEKFAKIYWQEAKKAGYWSKGSFKGRWDNEPRTAPYDYGIPFNLPNHPVVGVSWYEALAFTRWLTDRYRKRGWLTSKEEIRLPIEVEWEKAARGGIEITSKQRVQELIRAISEIDFSGKPDLMDNNKPHRIYPWGNEAKSNLANYDQTGIGQTSVVGCFQEGKSPYGCEEMSGNVWEWCENLYGKGAITEDARVLRGGSWGDFSVNLRCSIRDGGYPDGRWRDSGFRVVCCQS